MDEKFELQKTVEETVVKGAENDITIASLSHELKQKDTLIEELQSQLLNLRLHEPFSFPGTPHELSDFNNSEGGLNCVVRRIQEAVGIIQVDK